MVLVFVFFNYNNPVVVNDDLRATVKGKIIKEKLNLNFSLMLTPNCCMASEALIFCTHCMDLSAFVMFGT